MTKSELMILAHTEARKIVAKQGISYCQAMVFGMRRAHNAAQKARLVAAIVAQPVVPNFLYLRGM